MEEYIMKKSIRLTAAAIAAITAISCTSIASFADDTAEDFVTATGYEDVLDGGWMVNGSYLAMSKNAQAKAALKRQQRALQA